MTSSHAIPMGNVLVLPTGMTALDGDQMVKTNGGAISLGCAVLSIGFLGFSLVAIGAIVYLASR